MRRLSAILLLLVFSLPLVSLLPAMAQGTDAGLPACCRRVGKHHCAMTMGERAESAAMKEAAWRTPADRCPYCPASVASAHFNPYVPGLTTALSTHHGGPVLRVQQIECQRRIARERARHKRGPPTLSPA